MLKRLIQQYGKDKINTLTKYPSILTLHRLGEKGILKNELSTSIENEKMYATEKIDGTNVRIICYGDEYLIGSREFVLHHSADLYFDPAGGIVEGIKKLLPQFPQPEVFTVIYGEYYGGKISANSKWYGQDKVGFRIFDVAIFEDLSMLDWPINDISIWRERETPMGIVYGQHFLTRQEMTALLPEFEFAPLLEFDLLDLSHQEVLNSLRKHVSKTQVALSENAIQKAEGIVLRNEERTKIVKVRFEDYERTLKVSR